MDLSSNGVSDKDIGLIVGRSENAVRTFRCRIKIPSIAPNASSSAKWIPPARISYENIRTMAPLRVETTDIVERSYANAAFLISMLRAGHVKGQGELHIPTDGTLTSRMVTGESHLSLTGSSALLCAGA